jgi:hypothetical protein
MIGSVPIAYIQPEARALIFPKSQNRLMTHSPYRSQESAPSEAIFCQVAEYDPDVLESLIEQLKLLARAEKIVFRGSGCQVRKIAICGNCCGTGTGWCRRARGS